VEFLLIGPADLSASFGAAGQWEGPGVPEAILTILNTARVAGKQCGILGTSADDLNRRRDQGFRLLGLGADASLLFRALSSLLAQAGRTMPPLGEDR
jgi:2-keto-3-deoxy-L-rhamnonate aldolase RhmA